MTESSIFCVLGLGLDRLRGQCPHHFLRWCPQWLLGQQLLWLLLQGDAHVSLEELKAPQSLAAAQEVAGAHGTGQCWLPEDTQAEVRAEVTAERGQWGQGLASGLFFF